MTAFTSNLSFSFTTPPATSSAPEPLAPRRMRTGPAELLDNCATRVFEFEGFVRDRLGIRLGVSNKTDGDPSSYNVCRFFLKGTCTKGNACAFKHGRADKSIVCKHWLRGLCKKGEVCEFLHEYNLKKMPECWFFSKYGECSNPECMYLHIDPNSKLRECLWYARGFCKHGPTCRNRHVRSTACPLFVTGFCPQGPNCSMTHPKWELSAGMLSHGGQQPDETVDQQ